MKAKRSARLLLVTVGAVAASAGVATYASSAHASRGKEAKAMRLLPEPEYLPQLARSLLHERMKRHGNQMDQLMRSVLFLQKKETAEIAGQIAQEPQLVRANAENRDTLNALLPERFFTLQDELNAKARELAANATTQSDAELARSFGQLTQTCVSCHSTYMYGGGASGGAR